MLNRGVKKISDCRQRFFESKHHAIMPDCLPRPSNVAEIEALLDPFPESKNPSVVCRT